MGKNITLSTPGLTAAVEHVAAAIRAHTAHVKEDDQRYWDEKNADAEPELKYDPENERYDVVNVNAESPHPPQEELFGEWFKKKMDEYFGPRRETAARYTRYGAINEARRRQLRQYEETSRPFPEYVVRIMQTTPHMYLRPPSEPALTAEFRVNSVDCRICELPRGNQVHQVLVPEFRQED